MDGIFDENDTIPVQSFEEENSQKPYKKKKKMPTWLKAGIIAFVTTCVLAIPLIVVLVHLGKINFVNFDESTTQQEEQFDFDDETDDDDVERTEYDAKDIDWSSVASGSARYDKNVVNILLVGEDGKSTQGFRGNSDTMIIFTIDKNTKNIKMTSLMRDIYVQIPDHSDNKLNSAYASGGIPLLKQTIEENFKVAIDYSVVVQFDTFQKVIELLGGVDVEINEKEAAYINKSARNSSGNLTAGMQHLNGEQTMWFSRIRKISSDIYGRDDFGRTCRQRTVLSNLFDNFKDMDISQIVEIIDEILPYITTDMSSDVIITTAALVLSYNIDEIESLRIPMDRAFEYAKVTPAGYSKGIDVILINKYINENVNAMHQFIYGDTDY